MSPQEQRKPPPGALTLDQLIEALQRCRAEPGVSGRTPARIAPEFGAEMSPDDILFASGVTVAYLAGSTWAGWVTVQYRREHFGQLVPDEATEPLMEALASMDRALANALRRDGYTIGQLRELKPGPRDQPSWYDLEELPNIGPVRLLRLVNFFRHRGIEFGWFAAFDEISASWTALQGRDRVQPRPEGLH